MVERFIPTPFSNLERKRKEQIMFCSKRFRFFVVSALVMFLALVFTAGTPLEARGSEEPPVLDKFVYLPMTSGGANLSTTISGKVMNGESPEAAGLVALMDQGAPGTPANMVSFMNTDSQGNYRFADVAPLRPGYSYFVRFNYQGGNTLFYWNTASIFDLKEGDTVTMPTFDVADVILTDPAMGTTVSLPYTFRWTPRPGNPDETYKFIVVDTTNGTTFTSLDLGYAGEYTLSADSITVDPFNPFPPQFSWRIQIDTADGSKGESQSRPVYFANSVQ